MQNPSHVYASCDSFNVKLIVVDIHGCNDTIEKYITVWCLPQASFTADPVCEGDTTTLVSTSVAGNEPSAPIIFWDWSFTNNTFNR